MLSDVQEASVRQRYAEAGRRTEPCLCVPSNAYDSRYLAAIPQEIVERDYGCGDPSRFVEEGETVLDLGSGSGKACYICAQKIGPAGRVIGVDFNTPMLALARKHQQEIARRLGFDNVEFRKGRIQDLALDLERLEEHLREKPADSADRYLATQEHAELLRRHHPMIPNQSIDVVVSNCVLNLVETAQKQQLFAEMFRVLRRGGRCVISDIVSDELVPHDLQEDPSLWSGCISGAMTETGFLKAFEEAGFHGMSILERAAEPWQTIRGIEFRSVTVAAYKGKEGPCLERNQAVVYLGPWQKVTDDDGHTLVRGQRMAVCDKTFNLFRREPYSEQLAFIEPREAIPLDEAKPFDCRRSAVRHPRQSKGAGYEATTEETACCGPEGCC